MATILVAAMAARSKKLEPSEVEVSSLFLYKGLALAAHQMYDPYTKSVKWVCTELTTGFAASRVNTVFFCNSEPEAVKAAKRNIDIYDVQKCMAHAKSDLDKYGMEFPLNKPEEYDLEHPPCEVVVEEVVTFKKKKLSDMLDNYLKS